MESKIFLFIQIILAALFIYFFLLLLSSGCSPSSDSTNYKTLYSQQLEKNNILIAQNDSLLKLISVEKPNYKKEYLQALKIIDSLEIKVKSNAANIDTLLYQINDAIMHISDIGLNNLIEWRKK